MLALTRKKGESLVINNNIEITVLEIRGDQVKIGISAPKEVPVYLSLIHILMEELLGVLEKEETEYLTLIDLADVKSQAIIKADIAKLGEVTEKEQEAASTLLNLSNKRTQVLNDMATVLGKKPEQMTINRMICLLYTSRCV